MPPSFTLKSALPDYAAATDTANLYGHNTHLISSDFENDLLASYRFQIKGETHLIMTKATTAINQCGRAKVAAPVRDFMLNLTQQKIETMKTVGKNVDVVYHGCLKPGCWLFCPAGWVIGQSTVGAEDVYGIRRSTLCRGTEACKEATNEYKALVGLTGLSSSEWVKNLLEMLQAELA
eukprot:6886613-Lingulodinium_polyedra.AAC.1